MKNCVFFAVVLSAACAFAETKTFNVIDSGAVADGKTLSTQAFQKALDAAAQAGGGEVLVPAGTFLIGSVEIKSATTLHLEKGAIVQGSPKPEDYPVVTVRWEGEFRGGHHAIIYAEKAHDIAIVGPGLLRGDAKMGDLRDPRGPCLIELTECTNVTLRDYSTEYSRMWSTHLLYCDSVLATGLHIRSDHDQSNGDGIDVDSTRNVRIENCDIDTGDDSIALKSGRGMEAVRIGRPTENVLIRNCVFGSRFAAVALGTEMSGGIRNIRIEDCKITRAVNAVYIKSRTGRGGFMENIEGENIDVAAGVGNFLQIDLVRKGIVASETVEGLEGLPRVANIRFRKITSQANNLLRAVDIDPQKPVENLSLSDVTGTCRRAIDLANIRNVKIENIDITGFTGALVSTRNVTGDFPAATTQPR